MTECPPGYRLYADVVQRLGEVRPRGNGLTFRCLFPERHKNGDRNPSARAWIADDGSLMARCMGCGATWKEIVDKSGTHVCDWYPNKGERPVEPKNHPPAKLLKVYDYRDRDGRLVYQKLRYEPGYDGAAKSFAQRRPLPTEVREKFAIPTGVEAWAWGLMGERYYRHGPAWDFKRAERPGAPSIELPPITPILYRLPELAKAPATHPVFVVEGEKDADLLAGLGFTATCGHSGCNVWLKDWGRELTGRRAVVVPDNNHVGREHAEKVVGNLIFSECSSVRVIHWDSNTLDPGEGGGIGNWLEGAADGARQNVIDLVKRSPEYARPVARPDGTAT